MQSGKMPDHPKRGEGELLCDGKLLGQLFAHFAGVPLLDRPHQKQEAKRNPADSSHFPSREDTKALEGQEQAGEGGSDAYLGPTALK